MGAHDCLSQATHSPVETGTSASHHIAIELQVNSDKVANVSAAAAAQSAGETVVVAGSHSGCKAKLALPARRAQHTASKSTPRSTAISVAVLRSKPSQSPKPSCAGENGLRPNYPVTQIASFGGALPPSGSMNCCPLTGPFATVATRARAEDNSVAAILEPTRLPTFIGDVHPSPVTPPLRLPNRGHTYLRCCAFLI